VTQETYDIVMEALRKENEAILASPDLAKEYLKKYGLEDLSIYASAKKPARKKRKAAAAPKKTRKK
jgi:hypothetical protein